MGSNFGASYAKGGESKYVWLPRHLQLQKKVDLSPVVLPLKQFF
jgi:hypothetical protein